MKDEISLFFRIISSKNDKLLFSCSVMSDSLWPHGLQHAQLPCPSPSPGACSNSWPLSQWCLLTISSSVVPFSSCPQFSPESMWQRRSAFTCLRAVIREKWNHFKEGSACCSPWGRKESDTTEQLNWTELKIISCLSLSEFRLCSKLDIMFSDKRNWGLLLLVTQLTRCQKNTLCSEYWTNK